jgi:L-rhamnose mutarotase
VKRMPLSLIGCLFLPALALPLAGCTSPAKVQRYGSVIGLRPDQVAEYKKLHANVWPVVLEQIRKSNIRNYSIYLAEINGQPYLFSYFEYTGQNYDADMAAMARDPKTQEWWTRCKPCQVPLPNRKEGEWWMTIPEVFHYD